MQAVALVAKRTPVPLHLAACGPQHIVIRHSMCHSHTHTSSRYISDNAQRKKSCFAFDFQLTAFLITVFFVTIGTVSHVSTYLHSFDNSYVVGRHGRAHLRSRSTPAQHREAPGFVCHVHHSIGHLNTRHTGRYGCGRTTAVVLRHSFTASLDSA